MGDTYLATSFKLLGAEAVELQDAARLPEELKSLVDREDIGLILVARDLAEPVMDRITPFLSRTRPPLVSLIPTPASPGKPVDMRALLMRALGMGG